MIERYSTENMNNIFSEENKFKLAARLELIHLNIIQGNTDWPSILKTLDFIEPLISVSEIKKYELETKHETVAFLKHLTDILNKNNIDPSKLHYGMTSSDVLDTVLSSQILQAINVFKANLRSLKKEVEEKTNLSKYYSMVGRTHGMFAEDIPVSKIFQLFNQEIEFFEKNLSEVSAPMKIRGPVGEYTNITERQENMILVYYRTHSGCFNITNGIMSPKYVTQVVGREYYANFITKLAVFAASIERFVTNIRLYSRTEVSEIKESFAEGQFGSSAMPHKKNPIKCENLTGISRLIRSYVPAALENIVLWHERDMSHSSVERVIIPDSCSLMDYSITELTKLISNLILDFNKMEENKKIFDYSSQKQMNKLIEGGLNRFEAYKAVKPT